MGQVPQIHPHFEFPFRFLKHVEKFETDVFPDCHTVKVEWNLGRKFINQRRHLVLIHHAPDCKYAVSYIRDDGRQLRLEQISE